MWSISGSIQKAEFPEAKWVVVGGAGAGAGAGGCVVRR
jgi:hypothetical protein